MRTRRIVTREHVRLAAALTALMYHPTRIRIIHIQHIQRVRTRRIVTREHVRLAAALTALMCRPTRIQTIHTAQL